MDLFTESLGRDTHRIPLLYSRGTKILCPLCVNRIAGLEVTKIRVCLQKLMILYPYKIKQYTSTLYIPYIQYTL